MILCAEPITKQQARQIAAKWWSGSGKSKKAPSATQMEAEVVLNAVNGHGQPFLYAVHPVNGEGYVLVSGDDCAPSILGYVERGRYNEQQMPDNMRSWLQHYAEEIAYLQRNNLSAPRREAKNAGAPIAKVLTSLWDQQAPYNLQCPMATTYLDEACTVLHRAALRTVTGCAATALAQVLYMWKDEYAKPDATCGKVVKEIPGRTDVVAKSAEKIDEQTVPVWMKFSDVSIPANTAIDWANLIDVYTTRDEHGKPRRDSEGNIITTGTVEQQNAIATLMHICGAAEEMSYGTEYSGGSATGQDNVLRGVYNYLGFTNARMHVQGMYPDYWGWVQALYDELKVAKAVFFGGVSSGGGHAFVIDGYDKEDLFHINWGWSGLADDAPDNGGYYRLNSMLPSDQGMGGSIFNDGFTIAQAFISGIYPNAPAPEAQTDAMSVSLLATQDTNTEIKDGTLSLYVYAYGVNSSTPGLSGELGISLENENGYKQVVPIGNGVQEWEIGKDVTLDRQLSWTGVVDGEYKIKMKFRKTSESEWTDCMGADMSFIRVEVSDGKATIHNSGRHELDFVSSTLKEEYIQREDAVFDIKYKVTKGSIFMSTTVIATPVKPDEDGNYVADESRENVVSATGLSIAQGEVGSEFTISGRFPADKLSKGYYRLIMMDLTSILPGNFIFQVTDKEPYKLIFDGTPFVKYSDANGVVYMGPNFYNHRFDKLRAFGYTVGSYTGSNGKTYYVDNSPDTVFIFKDTLTADVHLKPNYVLNESDLGDASVTPVWDFDKPDSVALFKNFQGKCCFVKPTWFDSNYIDLNMSCDATQGYIDNENNKSLGYANVGSGTKFTLPARYGTIYSMVTKEELSATTIADSTSTSFIKTIDANGNHISTLFYNGSDNDSIHIVVGEDLKLISISASYPGGDNVLTWLPDTTSTNTKAEFVTMHKSGEAGALLYNMSDLTLNGLNVIAGAHRDSCSVQIEVPNELDENKYLSASFQMGEGFSFTLKQVFAQMRLEGADKSAKVKMMLSDDKGNKLESRLYEYNKADSVLLDTLANVGKPNDIHLEGKITLKIWVYGAADAYRLYMPITCAGEICEVLRFPEGYNFTTYKAKSEIDLDGIGLLTVDSYEVIGVDDEKDHVILNAIEEVPMGDVLVIHSDEAGAVHHIPLTRADDAYVRNNNKLWVSDGTVKGGKDIYRFGKEGDLYVFRNSSSDITLPRGEIYLKYHSALRKDVYYLSEQDVPQKLAELLLKDSEDNRPTIEQYKGRTVTSLVLDGHTFYKNHHWNTLCLPFDIIGDNIDLTPLKDAEIWELDPATKATYSAPTGFDEATSTLTLNFIPARNIEPGKPYVFEWRTTASSQIVNPAFPNVTLKSSEAAEMVISSNDGTVQFIGTYAPETLWGNSTANLYMGANDHLEYPSENMTINAFNGYFLVDLGNGPGKPGDAHVDKVMMNIADEAGWLTRVIEVDLPKPVQDDAWYDMQGRKYDRVPTQHGIYIKNGRKIILK